MPLFNFDIGLSDIINPPLMNIIGTIKNKSDDVLSYISVDAEFFDSNNSPIDVFNEEMWDLSVPPNTERRFKITGSIASNKDIYVSHKITINQAERNAWL